MTRRIGHGNVGTRYFVGLRTVFLVRFDTHTRDRGLEVRSEVAPDPYIYARSRENFAQRFGTRQLETGPNAVPRGREAITSASRSIGDAVAKLDPGDGLSLFMAFTPNASRRSVNSYRMADDLELSIPWKDFPLDARIIRSILALHYEGTVTADDFANGRRLEENGKNLRFIGLADEVSDEHSENGDTFSARFRDLTSIFIDAKFPTDAIIAYRPGATLLDAITAVKDSLLPSSAIIRGPFFRPAFKNREAGLGPLDPGLYSRIATRAQMKTLADKAGDSKSIVIRNVAKAEDATYWDVITDLCVSHGYVPFIDLDRLVIQEPRTFFKGLPEIPGSQNGQTYFPSDYRKRIGDDANKVRRMVYGINLESMRVRRKFARNKAPAVEVAARDPDAKDASKRLITVIWPPNAKEEIRKRKLRAKGQGLTKIKGIGGDVSHSTGVGPAGDASLEVKRFNVHGIIDPKVLEAHARMIYESIGRGELGITFSTNDLASYSENPAFDPNEDPDLLDIRAGDPIQLLVAPTERGLGAVYSLSEISLMIARSKRVAQASGGAPDLQNAIAFLEARGFTFKAARLIARVLSSANLPTELRVQSASVEIDGAGGTAQVTIDARDYVRVRADPTATGTLAPGAPVDDSIA